MQILFLNVKYRVWKSIWLQNKKGDYLDSKYTYYWNFIFIEASSTSGICDWWVSLVIERTLRHLTLQIPRSWRSALQILHISPGRLVQAAHGSSSTREAVFKKRVYTHASVLNQFTHTKFQMGYRRHHLVPFLPSLRTHSVRCTLLGSGGLTLPWWRWQSAGKINLNPISCHLDTEWRYFWLRWVPEEGCRGLGQHMAGVPGLAWDVRRPLLSAGCQRGGERPSIWCQRGWT